jgi:hypothetical protein
VICGAAAMLMTEGHAALLGDLGDRGGGAGIERAAQHVGAFLDQALGARARGSRRWSRCRHSSARCRRRAVLLITPGARSAPFWQDWPIRPWKPERGSSTPTLSFCACARTLSGRKRGGGADGGGGLVEVATIHAFLLQESADCYIALQFSGQR